MRLALFLGIFGSLLGTMALVIPVPVGPRAPQDALPAPHGAAECFALTYPTMPANTYMPRKVRLEPAYASEVAPRRSWYAAATDSRSWFLAAWRPSAGDSLDLASYDSPRIRLPVRGEHRVGQVIPTGTRSLLTAMFADRQPVIAGRVACQLP